MQYPDNIFIKWKAQPVWNEEIEEFEEGQEKTFSSPCRYEVNNQAKKIIGKDGNMIEYNYDVFMPKTDIEIPAFTADYILNDRISGIVKVAKNNRFNSRLWL